MVVSQVQWQLNVMLLFTACIVVGAFNEGTMVEREMCIYNGHNQGVSWLPVSTAWSTKFFYAEAWEFIGIPVHHNLQSKQWPLCGVYMMCMFKQYPFNDCVVYTCIMYSDQTHSVVNTWCVWSDNTHSMIVWCIHAWCIQTMPVVWCTHDVYSQCLLCGIYMMYSGSAHSVTVWYIYT